MGALIRLGVASTVVLATLASCGGGGSSSAPSVDGLWVLTSVNLAGSQGDVDPLPLGATFQISGGQLESIAIGQVVIFADAQSRAFTLGHGLEFYENNFSSSPGTYSYGWDDLDIGGDAFEDSFTENYRTNDHLSLAYYFEYQDPGQAPWWLFADYSFTRVTPSTVLPDIDEAWQDRVEAGLEDQARTGLLVRRLDDSR